MVGRLIVLALAGVAAVAQFQWDLPRGFPEPRATPGNPMSAAKVRLGRYLFYDKRMSGNGTQSCASCHRQELAFTDGKAVAVGSTGQSHPRSSMSLVNIAYNAVLTWNRPDLRSLEEQARVPMFSHSPVELGLEGAGAEFLKLLRSDPIYRPLVAAAFPGERDPFTIANVTKALAAFERSIISARSPYDRFHFGGDSDAISDSAKRGEVLFFSEPVAGCFRCHGGFNFSDATDYAGREPLPIEFHNTALYNPYVAPNLGVFERTKRPADIGKFKAPTLRNIALTAPYMHDGSIPTLEAVLDHYAAGGRSHENPDKDKRMRKLALTPQNREDLLAFLRSLTDEDLIHDARFADPW
jgi:cytochrome c peroxidase